MSAIRSILALFRRPSCVDEKKSSSSVRSTSPFIASSMAIWSRSWKIPVPWSAQEGMLTLGA